MADAAPPAAPAPQRAALAEYRVAAASIAAELARAATSVTAAFADSYGQTAVGMCVEAGHDEALEELLMKNPRPPLADSALLAAAHGRIISLRTLAKLGANVNETDAMGATPLHRASENGHADVVQALCELGAAVDAKDVLQRTPLHLAVQAGAVACVVMLLKAGADITAVDDMGRNAGDLAEALRAGGEGKAIDEASMAAIYELFKDEFEAVRARLEKEDVLASLGVPAAPAAPAPRAHRKLFSPLEMQQMVQAAAAVIESTDGPIVGVRDIDTLVSLLLAKFHGCIAAGIADDFQGIYKVLDSAGDGNANAGDLASACLEMGVEVLPELVPELMERITGRPDAASITCDEFVAFCTSVQAPEQVDASNGAEPAPASPSVTTVTAVDAFAAVNASSRDLMTQHTPRALAVEPSTPQRVVSTLPGMVSPSVVSVMAATPAGTSGAEAAAAASAAIHAAAWVPSPGAYELRRGLRERYVIAIENSEAPDYKFFFRDIDVNKRGSFGVADLISACELWGVNATPQEFNELVVDVWGTDEQRAQGEAAAASIRVTLPMFLRFCESG